MSSKRKERLRHCCRMSLAKSWLMSNTLAQVNFISAAGLPSETPDWNAYNGTCFGKEEIDQPSINNVQIELYKLCKSVSGATKQAVSRARTRVSTHMVGGAVGGEEDPFAASDRSYVMYEPPPPYPYVSSPPPCVPTAPPYCESDGAPSPVPLGRRPPSDEELAGAIGGMSLRGSSPSQRK